MSETSITLRKRVVDTVVISGTGTLVVGLITAIVTFAWNKVASIDELVAQANSGIVETQEVLADEVANLSQKMDEQITMFVQELTALKEDIQQERWAQYYDAPAAEQAAREAPPEPEPQVALPPQQQQIYRDPGEILKRFKTDGESK